MERAGLRCQVSAFDPRPVFIFRPTGCAVGAFTAHIDDILGCREPDVPPKIRDFPGHCFRELESQESSCTHVGAKLA